MNRLSENVAVVGVAAVAAAVAYRVFTTAPAATTKPTTSKSTYKVYYWNGKGRGQVIRYALAESGVEWVDVRGTDEQFEAMKATGVLPYDQWPVLEVDGKILAQSHTIARFLAKRFGIYGSTDIVQAEADGVVDALYDTRGEVSKVEYGPEENKAAGRQKLSSETLPKWFGRFDRLLGDRLYIVNNEFTYADLVLMSFVDELKSKSEAYPGVLDAFPRLVAHWARIQARPNILNWLRTKPADEF